MSLADIIVASGYVIILFVAATYSLRIRLRRYRRKPSVDTYREVVFILPYWIMAVGWTATLPLAVLFDFTEWGQLVRTVVAYATLALVATPLVITAFDDRNRDRKERVG